MNAWTFADKRHAMAITFWNDSETIHTATQAILSRDQMPLGSILSCCSCFVPEFCSRNITQRCARVFVNKIPCYIVSHMKGYLKALVCLLTKYLAKLYLTWNDIWKLLVFCWFWVLHDDVYDYEYDDDIWLWWYMIILIAQVKLLFVVYGC